MKKALLLFAGITIFFFGTGKLNAQTYCTTPLWYAEGSLSSGWGMDALSITGFSGSTLSDAGIIAAADPTYGYLDRTAMPAINFQQSGTYSGTLSYGTFATYMESQIWIDFNDDGVFDATEVVVSPVAGFSSSISSSSTPLTINIPFSATVGLHRMRVRTIWMETATYTGVLSNPLDPCAESDPAVTYWSGTVVDYMANISPLPPCSGTPVAGTVVTSGAACAASTFTLSLSGATSALGLTYQWLSSPDGITYAPIVGATAMTYSSTETVNTYFKCIVSCGGFSATTPGFLETYIGVCYCTTPAWYSEGSLASGYGMDALSITGFSGSTLSDAGIIAAADPTDGYLDRTGLPATNFQQGGSFSGTVSYGTPFASYMETQMWIDFNDDGVFDATEVVVNPVAGFSTSSSSSAPVTINIPLAASLGLHRMRVRTIWMEIATYTGLLSDPMDPCAESDPALTYYSGDVVDYMANITPVPPCSGTPVAGTVTSSGAACASSSFTLSLSGSTIASGLTYQWQSSPDGITWTTIAGATSITYTGTEAANTYYQCIVTCSGFSATSSSYIEIHNPVCYCTTPAWYSEGSLASGYGMDVLSITGFSGSTLSDAGIIAAADPADGYLDRTAMPAINFQQNGSYSGTVSYGTPFASYMETQMWIDFNDDGVFDATEVVVNPVAGFSTSSSSSTPVTINIPITATVGLHRMRVRTIWMETATYTGILSSPMDPCAESDPAVTYYSGDVVDYMVNIELLPPCSGIPVAGTVTAPGDVCGATVFNLNLSGSTSATGITYQWQSSPDSITWTSIAGATTLPYATSEVAATYYRCILQCTSTPGFDTSAGYKVAYLPFCPCTPQYYYNIIFGYAATTYGLDNVSITGYGGSTINDNGPAIVPFNGYEDQTAISINFQPASTYAGTVTYNPSYLYYENQVWIDFNDDGVFDATEMVTPVFGTGGCSTFTSSDVCTITIPMTAPLGSHIMRVRNAMTYSCTNSLSMDPCAYSDASDYYYYGTTRDYIANILPLPVCSGTPVAGTISSTGVVCAATTFTLTLTGSSAATGLTYQWQSSPDGLTWTSVAGATSYTYVGAEATNTYFQCIVTCSGSSATTPPYLEVHIPICYCTTPAWYSEGSLSSGYGMDAISITGYSGSTLSDAGIVAAAVPSGYADRTFDTVNMEQGGAYSGTVTYGTFFASYMETQMWIDFNDDGIFDPSEVVVNPVAGFSTSSSSSTPVTINIPFAATPGVHRMRVRTIWMDIASYTGAVSNPMDPCAESDAEVIYYSGDVADYIVNIVPLPACSGTPVAGTITSTGAVCAANSFTLSLSGATAATGLTYQWLSSPDSITWTPIAGATAMTYSGTEAANTYYSCSVTCSGSSANTFAFLEIYSPVCYCTTPAWFSEASFTSGWAMDALSITGFSGSSLTDAGIIAACASDGYLDRTGIPAINFQQGGLYTGTVSYGTSATYMETQTWIDFNDDGVFDASEVVVNPVAGFSSSVYSSFTPENINIPLTATLGLHRMRVRTIWMDIGTYTAPYISNPMDPCAESDAEVTYWSGNVVDYMANIQVLPPCSGAPTAGTVVADVTSGCGTFISNLSTTGSTIAGSLALQWLTSTDGITFSPIPGATNSTYADSISANTWVEFSVTCTISGLTSVSAPIELFELGPAMNVSTNSPLCSGSTLNLTAVTAGTAPTWSGPNGFSSGLITSSITGASTYNSGTYSFSADSAGCVVTKYMFVIIDTLPSVLVSGTPTLACSSAPVYLLDSVVNPTAMTVYAIPYAAVSFTPTDSLYGASPWVGTCDDGYINVAMPFTFTYFGNAFTSINLATNGYVTFGTGSTTYVTYTLPSSSAPLNMIAPFYRDLYLCSGGSITYGTTGVAPNRKFVIKFNQDPNCCSGPSSTDQHSAEIILYETSNNIDILVSNTTLATQVCGIQDGTGTIAYTAPGENNTYFGHSSPEAWRFAVPSYNYVWSPATYLSSGTVRNPIEVGSPAGITFTVTTNDMNSSCIGPVSTFSVGILPQPSRDTLLGGASSCGTASSDLRLSGSTVGINYQMYRGSTPVGSLRAGTGVLIDFGVQTVSGSYIVVGTNAAGCFDTMLRTAIIAANPYPVKYSISSGGAYCSNTSGIDLTLSNSQTGVNYQLFDGVTPIGSPVAGTGTLLDFGFETTVGTYIVKATSDSSCADTMLSTAVITVKPIPVRDTLHGGGSSCGGAGFDLTLSGSTSSVSYQLYNGSTSVGTAMAGTGIGLNFGVQSVSGTYIVIATNSVSCSDTMLHTAVVNVNSLPTRDTLLGGGAYCAGSAGMDLHLSGSQTTVSYQLYNGTTAVGSPTVGTGAALDFGFQTAAGTYIVKATSDSSCVDTMASSALITINPIPVRDTIHGGGSSCGGPGFTLTLSGSTSGVNYQLFRGSTAVGLAMAGTGSGLSFGVQSVSGTYIIEATNSVSCTDTMLHTAVINVNPFPAIDSILGGGAYCAGGAGMDLHLSGSQTTVTYQLFRGVTAIGSPTVGTGSAINFGFQTIAGTYIIKATSDSSCMDTMASTAVISVNPLPALDTIHGGGFSCGGAGFDITLSGSTSGVNYQLYNSATSVGGAMAGTGSGLNFGVYSVTGTYFVIATNSVSCSDTMLHTAIISINPAPTMENLLGGGGYCAGGTGIDLHLSGSQLTTTYQLYRGATAIGSPTVGTGSGIDFGFQTIAGSYIVKATSDSSCIDTMFNVAVITVNPYPLMDTITGGGYYCAGGAGMDIQLSGSQTGVNYQLFNGGTSVGSVMPGTGSGLNFGLQTGAGTYMIIATSDSSCSDTMMNTVSVNINPVPVKDTLTGGGSYCAGGAGLDIMLSNSSTGISYQLYNGSATIGSAVSGTTGLAIDFGLQTAGGIYLVIATTDSACSDTMVNTATIIVNPLAAIDTLTGGGSYCAGGAGLDIQLSPSQTGINYQLYYFGVAWGSVTAGTGGTLDFGLQTSPGTYMVIATTDSACSDTMYHIVSIGVNPLPLQDSVMGGGAYCFGGTGVPVTLNGSQTGVTYQLYDGGAAVGSGVAGTGSGFNFGLQTAPGTYFVVATSDSACSDTMLATASVTINPLPSIDTLFGGGYYCASGTGIDIYLGSSSTGVSYQLYMGSTPIGFAAPGLGGPIDYGLQTGAGTYFVTASIDSSSCTDTMFNRPVIGINLLPVKDTIMGGGFYCAGGAGVAIRLSGSQTGVGYQLYDSTVTIGTSMTGTGTILNFGLQTATGTYIIKATSDSSCSDTMIRSVTISLNPLPAKDTTLGGGYYCAGGVGLDISISGSQTLTTYQLYRGASTVGAPLSGTGSALNFGLQTVTGSYYIIATSDSACTDTMVRIASINTNPIPAIDTLSGGGSYCAGGAGVGLGLSGSQVGIFYQLYNGATTAAIPLPGSGASIYLGNYTAPGTYYMVATTDSMCSDTMYNRPIVVVTPTVTPTINISALADTLCAGTPAVFTSTVTNAGSTPTYMWEVNGIGSGSDTSYFYYTPSNGDIVNCILNSDAPCAVPTFVTTAGITLVVDTFTSPVVTITASPGLNINLGQADTLTAGVTGATGTLTYIWFVNGVQVTGDSINTFISDTLTMTDTVKCVVVSTGMCVGAGYDSVIVNVTNGVKQISLGNGEIRFVPNPNKGTFNISGNLHTGADADVNVKITDMLGQEVYGDNFIARSGKLNQQIILDNSLADGAYILYVKSGTSIAMFHFILEK